MEEQSFARFLFDFLSGGTSGVIAKTVCAPVERVKLLMQTANSNKRLLVPYQGIIDCAIRVSKEEGFLSFWRGNWVNVIRYFPTQALNFSFKNTFQRHFHQTPKSKLETLFYNIISGGFAGCMTNFFVHPLDLTRTRLGVDLGKSVNDRQFTGMIDAIRKIYLINGIKGLYQGFGISFFGIFIYRGLYFGIYDSGKELLMNDQMRDSFFTRFFYAQFVVIFSESLSYPTDTIKRRMMMQSTSTQKEFKNSLDCFKKIYSNEGFRGLMRGNISNIARSFGSSLCLVIYDELQKYQRPSQKQ